MQNLNATSWDAPSRARWPGIEPGASARSATPGLRVWGPWLLAALLFGGLMSSFLNVVQQSVDRAKQQQLQAGDRVRAETRCQAEPSYRLRQTCLAGLKTATPRASMR